MGCTVSISNPDNTTGDVGHRPGNSRKIGLVIERTEERLVTARNWTNVVAGLGVGGGSKPTCPSIHSDEFFVDEEFPPNESSIFRYKPTTKKIVWKRPRTISINPVLVSDGTSRHDMKQGDLNDCWFLSTLSAVAEKPQLISKIIPDDNRFGMEDYEGQFHCRFWQFGEWVDVYIDDLLPTVAGEILFAKSSNSDEFWVSLVEKAYAKLNGSYESLEYGFEADAFTDMTGGLAEWYNPADLREQDFYLIRAAFKSGAVIGCLSVDKEGSDEKDRNGMVPNHSYVITGVEEIQYLESTEKLIRVRNPWGDTEWKGPWCDGSEEWKHVSDDVKRNLELKPQDDGEFWMCFRHFCLEYCNMIICNLSPDFDHDGISDKADYQLALRGRWKAGYNAGGWLECSTFHSNPQYLIILHPDINVQRRFSGRLPLVISLLQVYRRQQKLEGIEIFAIGFELFQLISRPSGKITKSFFDQTDPLMPENEETYAEYRETSGRFFLDPGEYLLLPTTQKSNQERSYLLRLFSVSKMECREHDNCIDNWDESD